MAYEEITNEVSVESGPSDVGASPEATEPDPVRLKEYRRWLHRIRCARKLRKEWEDDFQVETCEDFYLGKQQKGVPAGTKVINHFLATINVTLPGLLFDSPKFLARPKPGKSSPQSSENAKLAEGVLESISSQDDNLQNAAKFGLLQNFWRIGVLKIIYDPALEPNPSSGEPIWETDSAGNKIMDPMSMQPMPMLDPETGEQMVEPAEVMSDETYRFEWVDARCMLLPDDGPDMAKWTWLGEEIEVALEDAKADERFAAHLREKFRDAGREEDDKTVTYSDKDESDEENYEPCFRYVECYDLKKKVWYIITEQSDIHEFLLENPLPDGIEDHPYAILPGWLPNTGPKPSPWPLPFVNPWLDLQREYNIRRQQMMEGAKRSARKVLYEANTFVDADEALKALQSNKDMEGVMVTDVNRPPTPMADTPINASITNDVPALMMDWRIVTGQTGQKMGLTDAGSTATEATFVERASNLRDAELQKAVLRWLKTAGRKMWQLVRSTLTLQLFVKLRGMDDNAVKLYLSSTFGIPPELSEMFPEIKQGLINRFGQETIEPVTREDLQFEADIDIIPSSTKPRNLTVERQQWLEFLGLLAQAPQLALSRALLEETAAKFDFISPQMVEEIHALAITMMQQQMATAGHGGENPETGKGSAEAKKNGNMSQASQGTEMP